MAEKKSVLERIRITLYEDGNVEVVGFPRSFNLAYAMMTEALRVIVQVFLSVPSDALPENKPPKIITRKGNIIKL